MFILQMSGFPGSGKSTLAKEIAKEMKAVVLDRDIMKAGMLNFGINNKEASDLSYQQVYDLADYYLDMGFNVIIDTPCYYDQIIETGIGIATKHRADYKFIECYVKEFSIIKERLLNRENLASQIKNPKLESFLKAADNTKYPEKHHYMKIDTTYPEYIMMEDIKAYLSKD